MAREAAMIKAIQEHKFVSSAALVAIIVGLGIGQTALQNKAEAQRTNVQAPMFEVDPFWPKPFNGLLGMAIGVWVDEQDYVWIIHRSSATLHNNEKGAELNPPIAECCRGAPPVLAFDPEGNLVKAWGGPGPGYEWPQSNHGIHIDYKGNVWIGGNGEKDAHILKFTKDGKFLMQAGRFGQGKGSNDPDNFGRVAKIWVDPKTNEAYIADGYGNKRVAVIDADTGKMKRFWGAYGNQPDDKLDLGAYTPGAPLAKGFRGPVHCAEPTNDGIVYVCDRTNDRLQWFTLEGKFIGEIQVQPESKGDGSTWDVDFSKDPAQKYLYLADGRNQRIHIYDRKTMTELTNFGSGGHYPGQWYSLHSIAVDSKGNLYTTETYQGRRVQKFVYKGLAPVTKKEQGTPWPT